MVALAAALFSAAVLVLVVAAGTPLGALLSNLILLAICVQAVAACFAAAHRSNAYMRKLWHLTAIAFILFSIAQGLATVYENFLHVSLQSPWPSDEVFFIWMFPLVVAVLTDSTTEGKRR